MKDKILPNPPFKNGGRRKSKVIVAMSGGVDSSITVALLVKKGYQVEGVYMRLWNEIAEQRGTLRQAQGRRGTTRKIGSAEEHARAVAEKLGIGFRVLDFRREFKQKVADYFLKEFEAGRTPNPCVVCNLEIKFGLLFEKAMELGADYVATGHYACVKRKFRISNFEFRNKLQIQNKKSQTRFKLLQAKDKAKDQSYFLYNLTQKKLAKILFPLGDYKKTEVYKMAKKWKLPYQEGESFDICFIADKNHREFLKRYLRTKPGKIIDVSGKVLGSHHGLAFYTIGQRADIGGPGPFYVVELNIENNAVVVTNNPRDPLLYKKFLITAGVNWIADKEPKMPLKCRAKIRYGHAAVPCKVDRFKNKDLRFKNNYEVIFKSLQRAVTPGQSVVFYSGRHARYIKHPARYKRNEVLGGGVIS